MLSRTLASASESALSGRVVLFSVLAHIVLLAFAALLLRFDFESAPPPPPVVPPTNSEGETVQYFDIVPGGIEGLTAPPAAVEPLEPLPGGPDDGDVAPAPPGEERARPPPAGGGGAAGGGAGVDAGGVGQAGGAGRGSGGAGAFRPGYRDSRLYVAPRDVPLSPEPSEHEQYMEHLQARLDVYNDSIGAESDRARRATDWTVRDKDGGRWGISPEGIHLGSVKVPIPLAPSELGPRAREAAEERRQRAEIQRNEDTRAQRETMKERVRATRERKDAERRQARGESAPDSLR